MVKGTGIRQKIAVLAVVAALSCARASFAQAASGPRGAQTAATGAQGTGPAAADAAAYQKLNSGMVDEAAAAFQAVLAAQPDDAGALAGMGRVRILQGNYLGAVSFLERARQASPNDPEIATALDSARFSFLMGEGRDAQTAKDNEDAEKRYREALELRPDAREAVNALVNVLVLENKLSDAQDALSTAVAHEASTTGHPPADLEMQLAQLDIANSQPQLAYPIFLQVLQDHPDRMDAWSGLVSALHLMGHDADAVAQEKVIPAATRGQLEATPGFEQMMTAMANAPAPNSAASGPAYAPFVPSAEPPAAAVVAAPPAIVQPAPVAPPAMARVPTSGTPQRTASSSGSIAAKSGASRPASVSASAPSASRPAATLPSQTARGPVAAAQTAAPSRPAGGTTSGAPLVTQPAARPPSREEVPDTGEQQYPQPKARPRVPANSAPAQ